MFIFFTLLLIGVVSAFEFDNIKSYDEDTQTITVKNAFGLGEDITKITLNTPINYNVPRGYQKVAEFEIRSFDNYSFAFKELELYDKNNNNEKFIRDFDYKVQSFENVIVEDYQEVCTDNKTCSLKKVGEHTELREKWNSLGKSDFLDGEVKTIGIFTEVKKGDHVEWIPNYFGVRINEWATWTASLSADLIAYYKLDEPSGATAFDSFDGFDGTITGTTLDQPGIINKSYLFSGGTDHINIGDLSISTNLSVSLWINASTVAQFGVMIQRNPVNAKWLFFLDTSNVTFRGGDSGSDLNCDIGNITDNTWNHMVAIAEGTTGKIFINGAKCVEGTINAIINTENTDTLIGRHNSGGGIISLIDEVAIWNRTILDSEVSDLFNGGVGLPFLDASTPTINLNSPINAFNTTNQTINFNGSVVSNSGVTNATLFIDGILNETNSSAINDTDYLFTKTISDGSHNWTYESCNSEGCSTATTRNFTIDSSPTINVFSPLNISYTTSTIFFNATSNLSIDKWIVNYNGTNITLTNINTSLTVLDGSYQLLLYANNSVTGVFGLNDSLFFAVDATNPFINITRPLEIVSYHEVNTNITVNWTVSDLNLGVCILEFEGVNRTVTCLDNSTEINITNNINRTVIFYVNDTLGNSNLTSKSWNYTIFEHSRSYELSTIGGSTEDFELNVTKDNSLQISTVSLVYNLSASSASFTSGDNPIISKSLDIPNPGSDINFSFYFSFTLSDSQLINTSSKNQTVLNFGIGNCSTFTVLIYNFTLLDEENQTQLSNVTIDYAFNLFDKSRTTQITNFSLSSTVNPTAICVNQNLTTSTFSLDGILKYISTDSSNYLTRYYNILNFSLMNSSIPNNINLYDVIDTTATPFQLTFRDNFLVLTPNILVNVNKQFVSSNDFKTVEIPITDTNGQTILNLVRDTAIYNLILIDIGGNIVATFNKINAFCQDFTIGECTLNLDASSTITKTFNPAEAIGISYVIEYVNSTSTATLTFNSLNSTAVTARIVGTTQNQFGNQTVCDKSLTTTLGTLTCNASSILATDNYLFVDIFSDGNYVATSIININPVNPLIGGLFGSNGYFIAFFMLLLIIILFSEDKQVLLIMLGMGWVTILIFGLIKGTIIGSISGGIWLLVSIITMIWKLRQEEGAQ